MFIDKYKKTNNFLLLYFNHLNKGEAFNYLDAPIYRVSGADVPMSYAKTLETASLPAAHNVVKSIKKSLNIN